MTILEILSKEDRFYVRGVDVICDNLRIKATYVTCMIKVFLRGHRSESYIE